MGSHDGCICWRLVEAGSGQPNMIVVVMKLFREMITIMNYTFLYIA